MLFRSCQMHCKGKGYRPSGIPSEESKNAREVEAPRFLPVFVALILSFFIQLLRFGLKSAIHAAMLPIRTLTGTSFTARIGTFQGQKGNSCYNCATRMVRSALIRKSTPSLDMLARVVVEGSTAHSSADPSDSPQVVTTGLLKDLGLEMDGNIMTAMAP